MSTRIIKKIRIVDIVLIIIVIFFFANGVFFLMKKIKEDRRLKMKAERLYSKIIEDNCIYFMYSSSEKVFNVQIDDEDVVELSVKNYFDETVFNYSSQYNIYPSEVVFNKNIEFNDRVFGEIHIRMIRSSFYREMEKIAAVLLAENADALWEYDLRELEKNIGRYLYRDDIYGISIRDINKNYLVHLKKDESVDEKKLITIKKDFNQNGKFCGNIEIVTYNNRSDLLFAKTTFFSVMALFFLIIVGVRKKFYWNMVETDFQEKWKISRSTEIKMKKAIGYIYENYTEPISREELASYVNINADNLGRFFKIFTGVKINDYINQLRIDKAKKLLIETDDSIIRIALEVGFESLNTFYVLFQKKNGLSPSAYRRSYEERRELV